jgi:hypothetical protein
MTNLLDPSGHGRPEYPPSADGGVPGSVLPGRQSAVGRSGGGRSAAGDQVVVGRHLVRIGSAGSLAGPLDGPPPAPRPRHVPLSRPLPPPDEEPLGRDVEIDEILGLLARGMPVAVTGPAGIGTTEVLRRVAGLRAADGHEVIYLTAAGLPVADLLQELFQACFDTADYLPDPATLRRLMAQIRAVVVIDDVTGDASDMAALLTATPACELVFGTTGPPPDPELAVVRLDGLAEHAALALLTRRAGRALRPAEVALGRQLWRLTRGHPQGLLQAWAALHDLAGGAGDDEPPGELPRVLNTGTLTEIVAPWLAADAVETLGVLHALQVPVWPPVLEVLTAGSASGATLAELSAVHLITSTSSGHRAVGPLGGAAAVARGFRPDPDELVRRFLAWTAGELNLGAIVEAVPVIRRLLAMAAAAGRDVAVLELARRTAPELCRSLRWGSWHEALWFGHAAAGRAGHAADIAYFENEDRTRTRALNLDMAPGEVTAPGIAVDPAAEPDIVPAAAHPAGPRPGGPHPGAAEPGAHHPAAAGPARDPDATVPAVAPITGPPPGGRPGPGPAGPQGYRDGGPARTPPARTPPARTPPVRTPPVRIPPVRIPPVRPADADRRRRLAIGAGAVALVVVLIGGILLIRGLAPSTTPPVQTAAAPAGTPAVTSAAAAPPATAKPTTQAGTNPGNVVTSEPGPTGICVPGINNAGDHDFGTVDMGSTATFVFTMSGLPCAVDTASLFVNGANSYEFTATRDPATCASPLPPNGTCRLTLTFSPHTSTGPQAAEVDMPVTGYTILQLRLTMRGLAAPTPNH